MINNLYLKNFTAFKEADLKFSPDLNIIIGENSTGKTHLLKLGYLFCNAWPGLMENNHTLGKQRTEEYFGQRLQGLFKPLKIGNLSCSDGNGKTIVTADVKNALKNINILSQQKSLLGPMFRPAKTIGTTLQNCL